MATGTVPRNCHGVVWGRSAGELDPAEVSPHDLRGLRRWPGAASIPSAATEDKWKDAPLLIFNADDFGLTERDNRRILEASMCGVVKSTTILSNLVDPRALRDVVSAGVSTGVHVNLVEGRPLTLCRSLVGNDGHFLRKWELIRGVALGSVNRRELALEIRSQFENLLDSGVKVSHVDSHQNTHLSVPIMRLIAQSAAKYRVFAVRGQSAVYDWFYHHPPVTTAIKSLVSAAWRLRLDGRFGHPAKTILNAPGLGHSCGGVDEAVTLWSLALQRRYRPHLSYETPCHVGLSDTEYKLYTSPHFRDMLARMNIAIGSYHDF